MNNQNVFFFLKHVFPSSTGTSNTGPISVDAKFTDNRSIITHMSNSDGDVYAILTPR